VTRDFEQGGKHRHDGIDIIAPADTPIRAAADGEVIYSDWGPGGYGRIVILQHGTDLVTVYAHNHRNLVHTGQFVRQGDQIATVGKSGRTTGYHLHFEIRRKTIPISPFELLSRNRQIAGIESR
jgi:murein DD-endopeptidase MepM/ murein hydrolase activator NlpD